MRIEKRRIGDKEVTPFTIPSGIVSTEVSCLERMARGIPCLGILTTKSIGPQPRAGNREPILAQHMPGGFVNAVGLTNPGAEEFARKLSSVSIPPHKFLLASIFGKDAGEFAYVARTLEGCVDGFELNLSCPHAKGYGMQLGQDPQSVHDITRAVAQTTRKPVFAKLTPNAGNIGEIARAAVAGGAYGIVAINTVGPGYHLVDGNPVLTNKVGGLSGRGIAPIGLKCVRDIRQAVGEAVPIIGMGGIRTAKDVEDYASAGAGFFGIGSALAGMTLSEINSYLFTLGEDIESNGKTNNAERLLKPVDMSYRRARVESNIEFACDYRIIQTDRRELAQPGQFVFAWIPGVGEKPFSVMDNEPLTLGVLERGEFTKKINSLREGDSFYIRGPYGQGVPIPKNSRAVLVGGGCGIAALPLIAKSLRQDGTHVLTLLGARDGAHLAYLDKFRECGEVEVATEDGSVGRRGFVTDLFAGADITDREGDEVFFYNCGPRAMVDAVLPLELAVSSPRRIYSSLDYMTRCGVGICGSCADAKGRRTCVEGPFMNP